MSLRKLWVAAAIAVSGSFFTAQLTHAGLSTVNDCPGDFDDDGTVKINELIMAVGSSLNGCPAPRARFTDNADGTITDNKTGLMWEKKRNGGRMDDEHNVSDVYFWAGTCSLNTEKHCQPSSGAAELCRAHAENATVGCDECSGNDGTCNAIYTVWGLADTLNRTNFAGHTDWRIPTVLELFGILDLPHDGFPMVDVAFNGSGCETFCTDITDSACNCTGNFQGYWSATQTIIFTPRPYVVQFWQGALGPFFLDQETHVRAVRGGS